MIAIGAVVGLVVLFYCGRRLAREGLRALRAMRSGGL